MSDALQAAVASFDARTSSLHTMRNIGEHADEYAVDSPKRHVKTLGRKQLEVGSWDGQTFKWLQESDGTSHELNVDEALAAAEDLHRALIEQNIIAAFSKT